MNILLLILAAIFIGYSIETFHESRTKLNIVKVILFSFLVAFLASGISAYVLDKNLFTDLFDGTLLFSGIVTSIITTYFLKSIVSV
jgi:membrane protein insertase Oxa1/YidC/SpoIIIJ